MDGEIEDLHFSGVVMRSLGFVMARVPTLASRLSDTFERSGSVGNSSRGVRAAWAGEVEVSAMLELRVKGWDCFDVRGWKRLMKVDWWDGRQAVEVAC